MSSENLKFSGEAVEYFALTNAVLYVTRLKRQDYLSIIEEYFRYNISSFGKYLCEYRTVPKVFKDMFSRMCIFHLGKSNRSYFLQANRDTQEIEYLLNDKVDSLFNMTNATTFDIEFGKEEGFRKLMFNENGFFIEEYHPDKSVKVSIYDIDEVKKSAYGYEEKYSLREIMNKPTEQPIFCPDESLMLTITVEPVIDISKGICTGYEIKELDSDDKQIKSTKEETEKSLYSTYYDYMVEKGYFYSGNQKKSGAFVKK